MWLGFIDHTNEHLIGTPKGVLKCRAIRRHDASEQFDARMIEDLKGTPWKPVPGRESLKVPTNIEENGNILDDDGNVEGYAEENENLEERFNPGIDKEQDEEFERKMRSKGLQDERWEILVFQMAKLYQSVRMLKYKFINIQSIKEKKPKLSAVDIKELVRRNYAVVVQQNNPRVFNKAPWKRYENYKKAKTVAELKTLKAETGDIIKDIQMGYIKLVVPEPP